MFKRSRFSFGILVAAFLGGLLSAVFVGLSFLLFGRCVCRHEGAMDFERLLQVAQWGSIALGVWVVVLALLLLFDR